MTEKNLDIEKIKWQIKVETFFGRLTFILIPIFLISFILILVFDKHLPGMGIPHVIVGMVFLIWFGSRCLKKAKQLKDELDLIK
jgi:hypothetical protein